MNKWIKKSIELANSPGYLDKLSKIYIMQINPERPLPKNMIRPIKKAFEKRKNKDLIELLIDNAAVFPVKDSYIGFIRKKPKALDENPLTTDRIAQRLHSLGLKGLLKEASKPKETNRQLGAVFRNWLSNLGYKIVDEKTFNTSKSNTLILKGSDKKLKEFAQNILKCKLKKGIDVVIKKNRRYIIGEAKFLTTPGGEQDRGFDDASTFINDKSGNATRIVILDGYIWLENETGLHDKITKSNDIIMSALLLKDFIKSF